MMDLNQTLSRSHALLIIVDVRKNMFDSSKTMLDSNMLHTIMLDSNKAIYFQDIYFCSLQIQTFHLKKSRYFSTSVHQQDRFPFQYYIYPLAAEFLELCVYLTKASPSSLTCFEELLVYSPELKSNQKNCFRIKCYTQY